MKKAITIAHLVRDFKKSNPGVKPQGIRLCRGSERLMRAWLGLDSDGVTKKVGRMLIEREFTMERPSGLESVYWDSSVICLCDIVTDESTKQSDQATTDQAIYPWISSRLNVPAKQFASELV